MLIDNSIHLEVGDVVHRHMMDGDAFYLTDNLHYIECL